MQVREALAFLHELGTCQYFPSEFLKSRVVVNPQWLVNVMACLITVKKNVIQVSVWTNSNIYISRFESVAFDLLRKDASSVRTWARSGSPTQKSFTPGCCG